MRRIVALVALGLVTALFIAAPATAAPTRAQFVSSADAICADSVPSIGRKLDKAIAALDRERLNRGLALMNDALRQWRGMLSELDDLDPSLGDELTIRNWLSYQRDVVASFQTAVRQLRKGNLFGADRSVERAEDKDERADQIVADFGFEKCA